MKVLPEHYEVADIRKLEALQRALAQKVILRPLERVPQWIAGADVSYHRESNRMVGVFTLFSFPDLRYRGLEYAVEEVTFPYIPGLLSFRELPVLLKAFEKLKQKPDLILADAQGIAHPRRFGLASHLGVALDIPTIGCAKSKLYGQYREPGPKRGDYSELYDPKTGEVIGAVVRTRDRTQPLFVSPGHRVSVEDCVAYTLKTAVKYRIPEPTRLADKYSRRLAHEL